MVKSNQVLLRKSAMWAALTPIIASFGLIPSEAAQHFRTPQEAATAVFFSGKSAAQATLTNVSSPFAMVEVHGGEIEGAHNDGDVILLKHYSFGWQALETLRSACGVLAVKRLPEKTRSRLLQGMHTFKPYSAGNCGPGEEVRDVGPIKDVEAVRFQEPGPLEPYVVVIGNYAVAEHYGMGGGDVLYHRVQHAWRAVFGGGGAMSEADLRFHGVPAGDVCNFRILSNCNATAPSVSAEAVQASLTVERYYQLWDEHRLRDAYRLLSSGYQRAHPYIEWEKSHSAVEQISVKTTPTNDPMIVGVIIFSTDRAGARNVHSTYDGSWTLVNERGQLRLDEVSLKEWK